MAERLSAVFCSILIVGFLPCYESYKSGTRYLYNYETSLTINDSKGKFEKNVGVKLSSSLEVDLLWKNNGNEFFRMQMYGVKISGEKSTTAGQVVPFTTLSKYPIYFLREKGSVYRVYATNEEQTAAQNIKNGVISLFQYQKEDLTHSEVDISGECNVEYEVNKLTVTKLKSACSGLEIAGQFRNHRKLLDVDDSSNTVTIYELDESGVVKLVTSTESHETKIPAFQNIGTLTVQMQQMTLVRTETCEEVEGDKPADVIAVLKDSSTWKLFEMLPNSDDDDQSFCATDKCVKPEDLVTKYRDDLDKTKLGHSEASKAFVALVVSLRKSSKETIIKILQNQANQNIFTELIDAVAAAQTQPALEALFETVDLNTEDDTSAGERMFFSLSFTTHPAEPLILKLLKKVKEDIVLERLRFASALALGAMTYSYSHTEGADEKVISDVQEFLLERLNSCVAESCKIIYLTALSNAKLAQPLTTYLRIAETASEKGVALAALKVIANLDKGYITDEVKTILENIYHKTSRQYDHTIRAAALSILLNNQPSVTFLHNVLSELNNQKNFEFNTYILAKIKAIAAENNYLKTKLDKLFTDTRINNYNILAQKGVSTAFAGALADLQDGKLKYGLSLESGKAGIMKNSDFDIFLMHKKASLPIISMNLYADGLKAIAGGDEGDDDDDDDDDDDTKTVEATAGMILNLFGVTLPPVKFFKGQGEMMSAVWYAPSSLTPVYQGTILLHDYSQKIHLQNGMILKQNAISGLSLDLSGAISLSIWNRNANTLVESSGALFMQGSSSIDLGDIKVGVSFTSDAESYIDSTTDLEFYEMPFKMCLQMDHPEIKHRYTSEHYESLPLPGNPYKRRTTLVNGIKAASFPFHRKNTEQCKTFEES